MPDSPTLGAPRKKRVWLRVLLAVLLIPPLAFALWVKITLTFVFSSGERVGYLQKLAYKGWICKTWEAEIAMAPVPGVRPLLFAFTVSNEQVAKQLRALDGEKVAVRYEQHRGIPLSCFGETEYFAVGVRRVSR